MIKVSPDLGLSLCLTGLFSMNATSLAQFPSSS